VGYNDEPISEDESLLVEWTGPSTSLLGSQLSMTLPPDMEVVVEFDWRLAECARACRQAERYRVRRTAAKRLRLAFTPTLIAAFGLAIIVAASSEDPMNRLLELLPWSVILLLWLGLRFGGAGWLTAWQIQRNNPNMVAGNHHSISAAGYRVTCGQAQSTVGWPGVVRLVETGDFFLTFPTRSAAYYLPKRALSAEQQDLVRTMFKQQAAGRFIELNGPSDR
jgi:hypothetical protein